MANRYGADRAYATALVSASRRAITTSSGVSLGTERIADHGPVDTLVVAGGTGTADAMSDDRLIDWLRATAASARRVTSVGSGAFLLAQSSAQLAVRRAEREPLREALAFVAEHPEADLSVPALARRAAMSVVCTGALLLGAAGLLDGHEATTHWSAFDTLASLGARPTERRVVPQGKDVGRRLTPSWGGGRGRAGW